MDNNYVDSMYEPISLSLFVAASAMAVTKKVVGGRQRVAHGRRAENEKTAQDSGKDEHEEFDKNRQWPRASTHKLIFTACETRASVTECLGECFKT